MDKLLQRVKTIPVNTRCWRNVSKSAANFSTESGNLHKSQQEITVKEPSNESLIEMLNRVTKDCTEKDASAILSQIGSAHNHIVSTVTRNQENMFELLQSKEYPYLWNVVNSCARDLSVPEVINALALLKNFKVPQSTVIAQNLLQMIRGNINTLTLWEIRNTLKILHKYNDSILGKTLMDALLIIFERELGKQLDDNNTKDVVDMFEIIAEFELQGCFPFIMDIIDKRFKKLTDFNAVYIYDSLCGIENSSALYLKLLTHTQNLLIIRKDSLYCDDILHLLRATNNNIRKGYGKAYNFKFIEELCSEIVTLDLDLFACQSLIQELRKMQHASISVINYLNEAVATSKYQSYNTDCAAKFWGDCICYFYTISHEPQCLTDIKSMILANPPSVYRPASLIHIAHALIAFECYDSEIIKAVFSMDYSLKDTPNLLGLYRSVKTLSPKSVIWPLPDVIKRTKMQHIDHTSVLTSILKRVAGGRKYVRNNLQTRHGHLIDHAVLLDENKHFVAFSDDTDTTENKSVAFVEDLKLPHKCWPVLILTFPCTAYVRNFPRLTGRYHLIAKCVRKLTGHPVIIINKGVWEELTTKAEKKRHIISAIMNCETRNSLVNGKS